MLYVHGNPAGVYQDSPNCITIAALIEQFIKAQISFDDVLRIVKTKKIIYAVNGQTVVVDSEKLEKALLCLSEGWRETILMCY